MPDLAIAACVWDAVWSQQHLGDHSNRMPHAALMITAQRHRSGGFNRTPPPGPRSGLRFRVFLEIGYMHQAMRLHEVTLTFINYIEFRILVVLLLKLTLMVGIAPLAVLSFKLDVPYVG